MQKITAELLGSGRILLDGKQVNLPFKQAEALVYYLLVEKETFRPKLADIIWGDSADEHKVQSNMRNAIYVIRREFGRDFLLPPCSPSPASTWRCTAPCGISTRKMSFRSTLRSESIWTSTALTTKI